MSKADLRWIHTIPLDVLDADDVLVGTFVLNLLYVITIPYDDNTWFKIQAQNPLTVEMIKEKKEIGDKLWEWNLNVDEYPLQPYAGKFQLLANTTTGGVQVTNWVNGETHEALLEMSQFHYMCSFKNALYLSSYIGNKYYFVPGVSWLWGKPLVKFQTLQADTEKIIFRQSTNKWTIENIKKVFLKFPALNNPQQTEEKIVPQVDDDQTQKKKKRQRPNVEPTAVNPLEELVNRANAAPTKANPLRNAAAAARSQD